MSARRFIMFVVLVALVVTPVLAVQAGEGKGKVVRIDSAANVVVLEDGTMYRAIPDTVFLVEEKPVKIETLQPGVAVVIRSGEAVEFKDGKYILITPSASPASR